MLKRFVDDQPMLESRNGNLFRTRFRIPFPLFGLLCKQAKEDKLFGHDTEYGCCSRMLAPIELKVLVVLRILGRDWSFDDAAEATLRANLLCDGHFIFL